MDALTGEPVLQLGARRTVGARLQPPALDGDHGPHTASVEALRVADQHRPAVDSPGLDRLHTGEGTVGQAGGDDGDAQDDEQGAPHAQPADGERCAHGDARPAAEPGSHDRRERRRQHHGVGEHER